MLYSKLLGKTLRQPPSEAETISHQLLARAGMISQLSAGVYSVLPLGSRVLRRIEQIVREEMDAAGGQELTMPVLASARAVARVGAGRHHERRALPGDRPP